MRSVLVAALLLLACESKPKPEPKPKSEVARIEEIAVDFTNDSACARYADGEVACGGKNNYGQLGRGTRSGTVVGDPNVPLESVERIKGLRDVVRLVGGAGHFCALTKDGVVSCWGDGALSPKRVDGLEKATALFAGLFTTCAIVADGAVSCWGMNDAGQLGDGTKAFEVTHPVRVTDLFGATKVALGIRHSCALTKERKVLCFGNFGGENGRPKVVSAFEGADEIASDEVNACARIGERVVCIGLQYPEPEAIADLAGVTELGGGGVGWVCGLRRDATLVCWDGIRSRDGGRAVSERGKDVRSYVTRDREQCLLGRDDRVRCGGYMPARAVIEAL